VRFALTLMLWLFATVALAAAVPAAWAQLNIVNENGYATTAERAAHDPALQAAVASELTTRTMTLIAEHGGHQPPVDSAQVHDAAAAFTAGPSFPPLFGAANRVAHGWLFSQPISGPTSDRASGSGDQWVIDLAPMLKDSAFQQIVSSYHVKVPATLKVPLTVSAGQPLHQGQLHRLATWGPWVAIGAAAVAGVCGLLMLASARSRGKALSGLGVSALLVGGAGWAAIEVGGRYVNDALNRTTGDIRRITEAMVGQAEGGLHLWLNLTLIAGIGLVVLGVLVAVLGSLFTRPNTPNRP
jgi:hypothetical protein